MMDDGELHVFLAVCYLCYMGNILHVSKYLARYLGRYLVEVVQSGAPPVQVYCLAWLTPLSPLIGVKGFAQLRGSPC